MGKTQRVLTAGLAALLGFLAAAGLTLLGYPVVFRGRIYPGVTVRDVDLGGLTVAEASSLLSHSLRDPGSEAIELRAGEVTWQLTWADVGRAYDSAATASAAHAIGRSGTWRDVLLNRWRVRLEGRSVEPRVGPAQPSRVTTALEVLASEVHVPPADARLDITEHGVEATAGRPGRTLDVEVSAARVLQGLANDAQKIDLDIVAVPPRLPEPEPARTLAESLLAEPFTLIVDDPLTRTYREFQAAPKQVATWLRARTVDDQILLEVERASVQAWLAVVGEELGSERMLVEDETLTRTVAALEAGGHRADGVVRHPERRYVAQPGDTLFDIAHRNGFPQWRLEEANPHVEPGELLIGTELTIPSIDILFPEPLVPGKRIEIDLREQRLRAYEEDEVVYDFTCSTGMTGTPTLAGRFQILFKEPDAYAQRWSLEMPYFMAIYYDGPGFANGIHELPISAGGQRLWASVLGYPASYGCIILDVGDAEMLYDWAPVGTLVRIEGVAPGTPGYRQAAGEGEP